MGEQVHEADQLVAHRGQPGAREYKVRWAGYDDTADTWESASRIAPSLIYTYWERIGHQDRADLADAMARDGNLQAASDGDTEPEVEPTAPPRRGRGRPRGSGAARPARGRTQAARGRRGRPRSTQ
jgi:hypothetical protein